LFACDEIVCGTRIKNARAEEEETTLKNVILTAHLKYILEMKRKCLRQLLFGTQKRFLRFFLHILIALASASYDF